MLIRVANAVGSSIPLPPVLALVAAAVAIAEVAVLCKLFPESDPVAANALALTMGALILVVISPHFLVGSAIVLVGIWAGAIA
jgi:hypothetical protein